MNNKERKQFIVDHFDVIKKHVGYSSLLKTIKELKVLSAEMVPMFNNDEHDNDIKYNKLLNHLADMGLYFLKDLILETLGTPKTIDEKYIYKEIENVFINMLLIHDKNYKLEPFNEILLQYPNITLNVTKSTCFQKSYTSCLQIYNMRSKRRGVLFLVNNVNFQENMKRWGAQYDKFYLISLYREMGFTIYYFENLKAKDFKHYVDELITNEHEDYLSETDCLVLALLTHGKGSNEAIFYDEHVIAINDILYSFSDQHCPALKGKPKIFLFPFCRGTKPDAGIRYIQIDNIQCEGIHETINPNWADIIVCYGSVDGYQTLRDINGGSWFMQKFCKVLAEQAHEKDFETMMYEVKQDVMRLRPSNPKHCDDNILQTPSIVSIDFHKILFFNPGYFGNDK